MYALAVIFFQILTELTPPLGTLCESNSVEQCSVVCGTCWVCLAGEKQKFTTWDTH